jgi:predicted RNA-binding Zn-ribbon protein involved in translation (DUF1610 family)
MTCPICPSEMTEIDRYSEVTNHEISGPESELKWIKYRCPECGKEEIENF